MRSLLCALTAAGVLASSLGVPTAWADQCARPTEKAAFDVAGLKSELMVVAIACQAQDKYNAFVTRYRPSLVGEEAALNTYFRRSFGRSGQKQHDDYITTLANAQSDAGIQRGTFFCRENVGLFDEVMALKDTKDLQGYATTKALPQPIALVDCPVKPTKPTRTAKK